MKKALLDLLHGSGAFNLFRFANRNRALILMYHRFSKQEDDAATSARAFNEHLRYLTTHYRMVTVSQIVEAIARGENLPPGLAAISIDDGYRDAYEIALPLLRHYRVPATLYVVTDFIDRKTWLWTDKVRYLTHHTDKQWLEVSPDDSIYRFELSDWRSRQQAAAQVNALLKAQPDSVREEMLSRLAAALAVPMPVEPPEEFAPLNWDEVRELDAAGIEIGSHTVSHPILTRVDDCRLRAEIGESKSRLEAMLNRTVELFCYPNGDYNPQVMREVERAGYRSAVTTDYGMNVQSQAPLLLQRIPAANDLARFVQSTSGFEEAKIKIRSSRFFSSGEHVVAGAQTWEGEMQ